MQAMKKMLKALGIILGTLVLAVAGLTGYAALTPMKTFPVSPPAVQLPIDSASLAFGKMMVETVCANCHLGDDGKLSGRLFNRKEDPFGEMWSGNITQHPTKGIGRYSDGELAYLMRTGVNRDGRIVGFMMSHPNMSDEHLASIIAYLRSDAAILRPSEAEHPLPEYISNAMVKTLLMLGLYPPLPYDGKPVAAPDVADKAAYGRYLANEVLGCATCHSSSFETFDPVHPEKSPGFYGGGNPVPDEEFNKTLSSNLTPSKQFGLGAWTEDQFLSAVKGGVKKDGTILKPQMPRFAQLSDDEVRAIWAYLQTVPAIEKNLVAEAQ